MYHLPAMFGAVARGCGSMVSLRTMATASISQGRLAGKVAVVTASTEGIGLAIAHRLGKDGAKVVVSSRKQANVDKTVSKFKEDGIEVIGLECHVGKAEHRHRLIEETVTKFGGIDILVSNAAANPVFGPMLDTTTEEAWDKIFDTNVKSAFFLSKEVIPHMEKRGGGSIIFVSSVAGYVPFEFLGPYSVSKTALLGLVKAMAPQCGQKNIRVNGIAPGIIKTKFSAPLYQNEELENRAVSGIPLGRLGLPDDTAGTASFLASEDSKYITGETILVSGGMTARL